MDLKRRKLLLVKVKYGKLRRHTCWKRKWKRGKNKKKSELKTKFTGRQIQNLKNIVNKVDPPTQRQMAKKLNCSQSMINYLIKNRLKKKRI